MHKNIPCISLAVVEQMCKTRVGKSHGYHVLQLHLLIPYTCAMDMAGCLIKLFVLSFVKTIKTIPCIFNGMTWLLSL